MAIWLPKKNTAFLVATLAPAKEMGVDKSMG
jgi:hypothetical protein